MSVNELVFFWTINKWRGSKINGGITHPLYYPRFMLWLKYLWVLLSTPGMLHLLVSPPSWVFRCTVGLPRESCVFQQVVVALSVAHHQHPWDSSAMNLQLAKAGKLYRKQGSCARLYQLKNCSIFLLSILPPWLGRLQRFSPSPPMGNQTEGKVFQPK